MKKRFEKIGEKTGLHKKEVNRLTKLGLSGCLALAVSLLGSGWNNLNASEINAQSNKTDPLSERCTLKPDSGVCAAAMNRYYYESLTKECRMFIYGGCGGVVPFNTKEDCEKTSIIPNAVDPDIEPYPVTKYGGVGIRDFKE
ncbi:MAG TPA: BPTI/Kunitz domain-containing protein, partial [Syntrophorhabdaceae bacterium]|nr:BPTI/Kunitz domain-containing protein [Syntrophorhabdaceae bacterium]